MQPIANFMSAKGQAEQYKSQAAIAEMQARDVDLQSKQFSEQARERLLSSMSTIENLRASFGLSPDSPSAIANERATRKRAVRDENITRLGMSSQAGAMRMQSAAYKKAAKNTMLVGSLNLATDIGKLAYNAGQAGAGGGGGA